VATLLQVGELASAARVVDESLAWLISAAPEGLSSDQRTIRGYVEQLLSEAN
jgi:hypothetical protein